jgi:peptidoglycan hydrolase-like protein with peptidoglycan-binding domain
MVLAKATEKTALFRQVAGDEPMLRYGSQSGAVKMLQHYLVQAGADIEVDGFFGPITHQAVVAYQKSNGLDVDGIAGPQTWTSLKMGGGTVDADETGGGAFGQADLIDQTTAKLKAISLSLRSLSNGSAQQPAEPAQTLSQLLSGPFTSAGKVEVVGRDQSITSGQVESGEVGSAELVMAQPDEDAESISSGGSGQGSNIEMAALLAAAADVNQVVIGLAVGAMGGMAPAVGVLQNVIRNIGIDPASTLNTTTLSELDAVLADIQVHGANVASKPTKTGSTEIKITDDTTYNFKADTIAGVGQELEIHMNIHGEAAHVEMTPVQDLRTLDDKVFKAELKFNLKRELPKWTNANQIGQKCPCWKKEWDRFEKAIKIHEQTHVNIYKKFLAGLHSKCIGLTLDEAEKVIKKAVAKVEDLQDLFDTKTDHGQKATPSTKFNAGISCKGCQNNP